MQLTLRSILVSTLLLSTGSIAKPFQKLGRRDGSTFVGCYSSSDGLGTSHSYEFQSSGWCSNKCSGSAAFGLTDGSDCLCGDEIPPTSDKVDTSKCDSNCDGWPEDKCGGSGFYSVYTMKSNVETYSSSSNSSSDSTATASGGSSNTVSTNSGGQTVTMTAASDNQNLDASQTAESSKKKSSHNTAAIAAGVVVGVVGAAALAGAAFFFFRARKQKAQGIRSGGAGGFGRNSMPAMADSRFDGQSMAQRRQSNGSIDDDHDFSRRILQVTNPDR